jgi:iron complex transport system substrate-binding protein
MIARRTLLAAPLLAVPLLWSGAARAASALRVVTLGGAVTETVFALGAGGEVVGTDLTSLYPSQAAALPRLGYVRQLGAEGVLSLRPDLVLASADAGPPAALEQVRAAGVALVRLDEARDPAAACARIRAIGTALRRRPAADGMAEAVAQDVERVRRSLPAGAKPRVLFLLSAGRAAPMAAGSGTAAEAMIALAGGANAIQGLRNYRALSAEAVIEAAPDVILTTTDTMAGVGGPVGMLALPGIDGTPAARHGRVAAFDGLELLGFGPRLPVALAGLAQALHPGISLAALPARAWTGPR